MVEEAVKGRMKSSVLEDEAAQLAARGVAPCFLPLVSLITV